MTFSKISRGFAFLIAVFYASSTLVYADTFSGKIVSIRALKSGQSEVVLSKGSERQTIRLDSKTTVESVVSANKLKVGSTIYLAPAVSRGASGGGGYKGIKSPFRGIPKNMQKSMGLPNMPETPDIPGQPAESMNLPKVPKVPKVPKAPKKKEAEEVAEEEQGKGQKQARKPAPLPVAEPTEEEKSLYGKISSDKPLLKSTDGSPEPQVLNVARKVLSVKLTKQGVQVELEDRDGKKEKVTLPANRNIVQAFSSAGLRKNMQVQAETVKTDNLKMAQRIIVVS